MTTPKPLAELVAEDRERFADESGTSPFLVRAYARIDELEREVARMRGARGHLRNRLGNCWSDCPKCADTREATP